MLGHGQHIQLKPKRKETVTMTNYNLNGEGVKPIPSLLTLLMKNWAISGLIGDSIKYQWRNTNLIMLSKRGMP